MLVDRLNAIREARGLSAREFALGCGWQVSTVYNYLKTPERIPPATFIADVCSTYNVNPRWLLLNEGTMDGGRDVTNIDRQLLEESIAAVDEAGGADLPAEKKAKLVVIVYEGAIAAGKVDKAAIPGLISLAK